MDEFIKNEPEVHIIILNYNGWKDTIECVNSLLQINYSNSKIVIVDNNSNDGSIQEITGYFRNKSLIINLVDGDDKTGKISRPGQMIMIRTDKNGGYGYGNNTGIRFAIANGADYVLILNNDTVVEPDFLQPLIDTCESDKKTGVVSGKIYYFDRPDVLWSNGGEFYPCTGKIRHYDFNKRDLGQVAPTDVTFLNGCMWLVPERIFNKIGLLNEDFFMYVEDLEFCSRVLFSGFSLKVCEKSHIYHKVGKSSGGSLSRFSVYWRTRNMVKFILNSDISPLCKLSSVCISNLRSFVNLLLKREFSLISVQFRAVIELFKARI